MRMPKHLEFYLPCNLSPSSYVAIGMLHGQNSYVESTSSSSPMPRSVDPSQFCIDESYFYYKTNKDLKIQLGMM
ncbi:hypothetical protein H5410_044734 [Solanum commersonii]|uniref:Uncharacterized protein n=1 Tax=Solanum commersonii TaxID=4109 RepID=A0A9J5XAR4_SOLCO|nr:hypothetical protein H5410_044734 [Solanum commersonii]